MTRTQLDGAGQNASRIVPAGLMTPARLDGTDLLFLLYLTLLVVEYQNIPQLVPVLKLIRFATLLAWSLALLTVTRVGMAAAVTEFRQSKLLMAFLVFTGMTVVWGIVQSYAVTALRTHFDYFGLFLVTLYMVDRPKRLKWFCLVASLLVIVLVARNLDKLSSAQRIAGFRGGFFLGDGNDFAWGITVLFPLAMYLVVTKQGFSAKLVGLGGIGAGVFGIVGTQSRGATLALGTALLYYWLFVMKRKTLGAAVLAAAVVGVFVLAPSHYVERMRSIENYSEDNSARGRLQVWGAAIRMSIDRPLGVGANNFSSAYGRFYMPQGDSNQLQWAQNRWLAAHSVYFRLLGEYGVLGVIWIFTIMWLTYKDNAASHARLLAAGAHSDFPPQWPLFVNMSLIGYAVAAIFLGGVAYPHLYIICALTASATRQSLFLAGLATSPGPARAAAADARQPAALPAAPPIFDIAERARIAMHSRPRRVANR